MPAILLLLIILLPLIEIAVFVEVGADIGALSVVVLTVATAALGITLVRAQGFGTLQRAQRELDHGRPPVSEMMHGALLVVAGVCLLVPGFLTDAMGALLLIPPLRGRIIAGILSRRRPVADDGVVDAEHWEVRERKHLDSDHPPRP